MSQSSLKTQKLDEKMVYKLNCYELTKSPARTQAGHASFQCKRGGPLALLGSVGSGGTSSMTMQREIRVDLLSPQSPMVLLPPPPDGVRVRGLRSDPLNGPTPQDIAWFFLVTVPSGIAINVFSSWLYDRIRNHRADRFRIQGREPKDVADFKRIVREELEIGKND